MIHYDNCNITRLLVRANFLENSHVDRLPDSDNKVAHDPSNPDVRSGGGFCGANILAAGCGLRRLRYLSTVGGSH